jgi:p21-activated kinase 1
MSPSFDQTPTRLSRVEHTLPPASTSPPSDLSPSRPAPAPPPSAFRSITPTRLRQSLVYANHSAMSHPPPPRPSRANTANLNDMNAGADTRRFSGPPASAIDDQRESSPPQPSNGTIGSRSRSGTTIKNKKGMLSFMSGAHVALTPLPSYLILFFSFFLQTF